MSFPCTLPSSVFTTSESAIATFPKAKAASASGAALNIQLPANMRESSAKTIQEKRFTQPVTICNEGGCSAPLSTRRRLSGPGYQPLSLQLFELELSWPQDQHGTLRV